MYLKRIEIAGFKSFADRTVIDFENNVTAIVGPNGSGKSNITEAIRWVLGEQSAKNLRGGKMPDIIFAGSDSRKQLNIAEVTMVLENSDHYLPSEYSEISVTRRLRRSGESDFYINKQSCRLKDIQELFMDSGLGKESFSIISQGKVEAIFSSKPEDRRGIFEEAAGVLKYKQRKKKAEQKLFETEDNLSRVQDIVYELEEQLTPLKKQSEDAQRFLQLKETLKTVDVAFCVAEITSARNSWLKTKKQLTQIDFTLQELAATIATDEQELQKMRQTRSEADQWLEHANEQLLTLTEALNQAAGQREVLLERSKHTQKSSQEYQEALEETLEQIANLEENKGLLISELSKKNREAQELERAITKAQNELAKYQKSTKEVIEELRGQYVEKMQEHASIGNELKFLERQYLQEHNKNQQTTQKQAQLTTEIEKQRQLYQASQTQLTTIQSQVQQQRLEYSQTRELLAQQQQQFTVEQKKMFELMNQLQQVRGKQKSLQEIQENYSGFYQGVRLILQHRAQLMGIKGAVAELVEVPAEYTLAIETALGASAQSVVVDNEQAARNAITYLKQQRGGRATFLPLTTIKARQLPPTTLHQAQLIDGFLGVASELVNYPDEISQIAENLLGSVLIARDLESANALAKAIFYKYRVVSLEGDVMNAGGSMTGGATRRGQGSLFSQSNELTQLKEQGDVLDQRLQRREQLVRQLEKQVNENQLKSDELRQVGEEGRLLEQELVSQTRNYQQELERLEKEAKIFAFENREVQLFLEEYTEQKEQLLSSQKRVEEQRLAINQEIQAISAQEDVIEGKRQSVTDQLAQLKAQLAVTNEQINNYKERLKGNQEQTERTRQRQVSLTNQIQALSGNVLDHEVTEESLQQKIEKLTQQRSEIQTQLQEKRQVRQKIQQEVSQLDQALVHKNHQQKDCLAEKTTLEVEKKRLDISMDTHLTYLQEEYLLTFEAAEQLYPALPDLQAAKAEINQLKQAVADLGPVNLNAIEQYQQVLERYEFLTGQRDDLLAAKEQLFETMSEMDDEVKRRFKEVFEAIRVKFKEVFPNMFGGGRAELLLTNPSDLLNTGIEIESQPPGKKLQSLSLLSGGERTLTAIALLFAIIQTRPVPFCVLDEVEAALDEANVNRFGRYLTDFNNDTQFIVVTHRKGTMEAANVLYGVTMQESGVSKTVSVRLEEVTEGGQIAPSE
ncbi:MAG: chromosome segregation protein SMC [Enterococcus sp.]